MRIPLPAALSSSPIYNLFPPYRHRASNVDPPLWWSCQLASRPVVAAILSYWWGACIMDFKPTRPLPALPYTQLQPCNFCPQFCIDAQDQTHNDNRMNHYPTMWCESWFTAFIDATWLLIIGCCWLTLCGLLDGVSGTINYSISAAFASTIRCLNLVFCRGAHDEVMMMLVRKRKQKQEKWNVESMNGFLP
jgi:hypothetical protein